NAWVAGKCGGAAQAPGCCTRAARSVALRTAARAGRRFSPAHARQRRGVRLHRRVDGGRHLACDEHRRFAPDPGLRVCGPARLRSHFDPLKSEPAVSREPASIPAGWGPSASIELKAALRYTGTRLPEDAGLGYPLGARGTSRKIWHFSPIYQRLSDV